MKGFLQYGESIVLYSHNILNPEMRSKIGRSEINESPFCGFLSTKGYMDTNVYFQTVETPIEDSKQKIENIANFRDFVFQVTPKLKHEFNNAYQEVLKEFKKLKIAYKQLNEEERKVKLHIVQNFEKKLKKAKQRARKEDETNSQLVIKSRGQHVKYGDIIQLRHKDSQGFLVAKNECSKTEQIGYGLEISNKSSSRMNFTFIPRFKSRSLGDIIQYTDNLRLVNMENKNNLAISLENYISPKELYHYEENPYIVQKVLLDIKSYKHIAFLGGENFSTWKIFLCSKSQQSDEEAISGTELVRIRHSELTAYLASSLCFEGQTPEIYFRNYHGEYQEENSSLNTIWEICHQKQIYQGTSIKMENDFITLRHFNSGKLLCVEPLTGRCHLEMLQSGNIPEQEENDYLHQLQIIPVQKGLKYLKTGATYRFKHTYEDHNSYLSHNSDMLFKETLESKASSLKLAKDLKFTPLEDTFFDEVRNKACFFETINVEEAYVFEKITEQEKKDILYLRSAIPEFMKISKIYKYKQTSNLSNQKLVVIEELLKKLIAFLFDQEYDPDIDYIDYMDNEEPRNMKQLVFKDLNFLEMLVDIIHYPFLNGFYDIKNVHKKLYAPQVLALSYSCIRYAIMEYRPSELYASQWLDLFIEYSLGDLDESLKANETLTELIDNNRTILDTRIKTSTINKFVTNLVESGGEKKFVEILRAICICDEKPMLNNQQIISKELLHDDAIRDAIILPLMKREGILCARDPWSDIESWVPLSDLEKESNARDDGRYYNFYYSSIFLLSDLCQNRNYSAIEILRSYFAVETCISIMTSDIYDYKLRSAFCKLTQNLWIDAYPFVTLTIPSKIKIWKDVNPLMLSKTSTKNIDSLSQYEGLIEFIFKYLAHKNVMTNYKLSGQFLVEVILLCTKMLKLGFFYDFKQYVRLFKSLKNILTKTDQIALNFGEKNIDYAHVKTSKHKFKKIELVPSILDIKKRICKILKIMIMVQNDFKINDIIKDYKAVMKTENHKAMISGMSEHQKLLTETASRLNNSKYNSRLGKIAQKLMNSSNISENNFKPIFEEQYSNKNNQFITKDKDFITMLETQTLYQNASLKSIALDLLYSLFKTTDFLSEMVVDLQIIENQQQIEEYENLQEIRNYLFRLGETIETWYPKNSEKEISHILLLLNRIEIMLHIKTLDNLGASEAVQGLEESNEIDQKLEKNPYLMINLNHNFLNLNKFTQDMMRNLGIIDDLLEILSVIQSYKMSSVETLLNHKKKKITFLLHLILAEVCHENKANTHYLNDYINTVFLPYRTQDSQDRVPGLDREIILNGTDQLAEEIENNKDTKIKFLEMDEKLHAPKSSILLINHLMEDNKPLLFNPQMVSKTINQILVDFDFIDNGDEVRLAYYLYTLQKSLYFESFSIRPNQNMVVSRIIAKAKRNKCIARLLGGGLVNALSKDVLGAKSNRRLLPKVLGEHSEESSLDLLNDPLEDRESEKDWTRFNWQGKQIYAIPDELCFDLAFIELLCNCSFDKNAYAENISSSVITGSMVEHIIDLGIDSPIVNYEIYKFIFHVYVETEKNYNTNTERFLFKIMKRIKRTFEQLVNYSWSDIPRFFYLSHKELVGESQVMIDLANICVQNLNFFIKEICKDMNFKIEKKAFLEFVSSVYHLYEEGKTKIKNDFLVKTLVTSHLKLRNLIRTNSHFREHLEKFSNLQPLKGENEFLDNSFEVNEEEELNGIASSRKKLVRKSSKFEIAEYKKLASKGRSKELVTIFRQSFLQTFNKVQRIAMTNTTMFLMMAKHYFNSKEFSQMNGNEFRELLTSEAYNSEVFNGFLSSLVEYLHPKNKQDEDIVKIGLNIFLEYVGNYEEPESKKEKQEKNEKEKDPKNGLSKSKKKIKKHLKQKKKDLSHHQRLVIFKQDFLIKIGVVELLCEILNVEQEQEIVDLTIEVCSKIIEGGNVKGQNEFLRVFKEKKKLKTVRTLKNMMNSKFQELAKMMSYKNSVVMKKLIFGKKVYDVETTEMYTFEKTNNTCIKILRFMQLLCEGHNKNLQNYLRVQTEQVERNPLDESNSYKKQNIDFILYSVELFGSYIKFFNSSCHELGNMLLEFMVEAIQGPCYGNQRTMRNSKILDYVKDFLNDLNANTEDLKARGFMLRTDDRAAVNADLKIIDDLFTTTIKLLLSILESNDDKKHIEKIGRSVHFEYLVMKLRKTYLTTVKQLMPQLGITDESIYRISKFNATPSRIGTGNMNKNAAEFELEELKRSAAAAALMKKKVKKFKREQIPSPDKLLDLYPTKTFSELIRETFNIFSFIQIINDHSNHYISKISSLRGVTKHSYSFFKAICGHIELVFEDKLQKVYFIKHPATRYLHSKHQIQVMNSLNLTNTNEKLNGFLQVRKNLFSTMDHNFDLKKKLGLKLDHLDLVRNLALLVSTIINMYMLVFFEKGLRYTQSYLKVTTLTDWGIWCLGIVHLILSFIMVLFQFILHSKLFYYNKQREFLDVFKKRFASSVDMENQEDIEIMALLEKDVEKLDFRQNAKIIKKMRELNSGDENAIKALPRVTFMALKIQWFLSDGTLRYFIFYLTCSFFAIYFDSFVIYSFSLFEIINRFDTLRNVINAITYNKRQLILTTLLGVVITYVYACLGYFFIVDSFWNDSFGDAGENQCISVFQCFFTLFSLGPRSSGGIGDMMIRESYGKSNRGQYIVRFFYDVSCFMIINIILLNIIFGIIIDTFAELRKVKTQIEDNKANVCFICSLQRNRFDKTPEGFDSHVEKDHNTWNYLFYLYYLKRKQKVEFTGIDTYVKNMIDKDDHFWIPIEKALSISFLNEKQEKEEDHLAQVVDRIGKLVEVNRKWNEKQMQIIWEEKNSDFQLNVIDYISKR